MNQSLPEIDGASMGSHRVLIFVGFVLKCVFGFVSNPSHGKADD
jgi:hypothetical protein